MNRLSPTAMTALFMDRPRGGRSVSPFTLRRSEGIVAVQVVHGEDCCILGAHSGADLQLWKTQLHSCFDCGEICEGVLFLLWFSSILFCVCCFCLFVNTSS